jgi:PKD repeat protein
MKYRSIGISLFVIAILIPLVAASQAPLAPREFVPVQKGFVSQGERVLPYAPDRILVKFKENSLEKSKLNIGLQRGSEAPGAQTGIASVDALVRSLGVMKITRPYIELKNKDEAARLGIDRWYMMEVATSTNIMDAVDRLAADPNVEYAKPDWAAFPAVVPTDPLYPDHWGHNNTAQLPALDWGGTYDHTLPYTVGTPGFDANAQAAWDVTYGSSNVIIAIIDTGVDIDHPDLNVVSGYDFGDNDSNPDDNSAAAGHGTCCAGVAASMANNGRGACGAAPGARIMPLKVASSSGSMYFSAIENAFYYAADHGADVISVSLGAYVSSDPATDAAITYAHNAGCIIVAATSNDNDNVLSYPANHAYVVGVGAASPCGDRKRSSSSTSELNPGVNPDPNGYTCDGERWWGSNYGTNSQDAAGAVDILGPTILPTTDIAGSGGYRSGDYEPFFNGTSCATPYVAGVCALIKTQNPGFTAAQVRNQLVSTAIDIVNVESGSGWDRYSGYGMVDAEAAVGGGGGPVAPTAAFVGSPTSGDAPLAVDFTDQSSGEPTSWSWNFGDGVGTSSAPNPSYTYNDPGTYTVSLTVSNAQGSDAEVKTNYITVTEPGSGYANLPYSTGFESGVFDQYWTTNSSGDGRILLTTSNSPHSGSYHMTMDDPSSGGYTQNEAWLHLNLSGVGDVTLEFWWKDFADETHTQDGVFFSDNGGASFVKVLDLPGASYSDNVWRNFSLDVDQLASSAGLNMNSTFVVKFQQYDNYPIATDGHAYDDISVTEDVLPPPVADFSGSPTSGTAPLQVQFTDESTGATSWSWNFGDNGTSTAQNPSHTYADAGTYTVSLTATNAAGSDTEVKTNYITVAEPGTGDWHVITYDDFEGGWGSYTDGGGDCALYTGGSRAHQGSNAADIQDNSGTASSFYHTTGHDVSGYTELEVEFWFYAYSMDNVNEDFWVQYYDGSTWRTVASYARSIDFNNNTFYNKVVTISPGEYNFPTNARLRFMCDASGNQDDVYIDEIEWRGYGVGGAGGDIIVTDDKPVVPDRVTLSQNFPNPFNPRTTIAFQLVEETHVTLEVFNVAGQRVATLVDETRGVGPHVVEFNGASFSSGIYIYRLIAGDVIEQRKMVLLK